MRCLLFLTFLFSFQALSQTCALPDLELVGVTKDNKKCEIEINREEGTASFSVDDQYCIFAIEDDGLNGFENIKNSNITIKGYSNWFKCKLDLSFDKNGRIYKAKASSSLSLALHFRHSKCFFPEPAK